MGPNGVDIAKEEYGVIVRLTPELYWGMGPWDAVEGARVEPSLSGTVAWWGWALAGARGALCDDATLRKITEIGERTTWPTAAY